MRLITLGYQHRLTQLVFDGLGKGLSRVVCISKHALDLLQVRCTPVYRLAVPLAIYHIRCCHHDRMRQRLGIHCNVTLDARDLFACVIALTVSAVRILHALRINDQQTCHDPAYLSGTGRADLIF